MEFNKLIINIKTIDNGLKSHANKSVNLLLTIRNWLVGYYIVEYEQKGKDRAQYGKKLLKTLAERLNRKGFSLRNLKLFRQFYMAFPEIGQLLNAQSGKYALSDLSLLTSNKKTNVKVNDFEHTNPSQLNTYINYYKKEIQLKDDNPPVGILMVTDKDHALVEYATAGMDENLFVSKYLLQLPDKSQLENFIKNELKRL